MKGRIWRLFIFLKGKCCTNEEQTYQLGDALNPRRWFDGPREVRDSPWKLFSAVRYERSRLKWISRALGCAASCDIGLEVLSSLGGHEGVWRAARWLHELVEMKSLASSCFTTRTTANYSHALNKPATMTWRLQYLNLGNCGPKYRHLFRSKGQF